MDGSNLVYLGARGVKVMDIEVFGPIRPLHSGHYGNWSPNPAIELSRLIASIRAEDGRVLISGFYDGIEPLGALESAAIRAAPPVESSLRSALGVNQPLGRGRSLAELINEPSLNVDGFASAVAGPGSRNIVPTSALATIDMRLEVGNDHEVQAQRVEHYVRAQGFHVIPREPTMAERLLHPKIARVDVSSTSAGAEAAAERDTDFFNTIRPKPPSSGAADVPHSGPSAHPPVERRLRIKADVAWWM